jgi:hypothetical protein
MNGVYIHAGPLTDYYAGGEPSGPNGDPTEVRDPEVIRGAVEAWRHWLNKELPVKLDWDEAPSAPVRELEIEAESWQGLLKASDSEQLHKPELWLPGEHDLLFKTRDLSDHEIWAGATAELQRALEAIDVSEVMPDVRYARDRLLRLTRLSQAYRVPLMRDGPAGLTG